VTHILVVANQKGGVGKTTTVIQAAYYFAGKGKKVLVVDLDGQANASTALGNQFALSVHADALFNSRQIECPIPQGNLAVIPASFSLNEVEELDISCITQPRIHLRQITWPDVILIDTPPSLGRRLLAALVAADFVLTPMELSKFSFDGLEQLIKSMDLIRERFNPGLAFLGILPTKVNTRSRSQKRTLAELYWELGEKIIPQMVAFRAPVADSVDAGQPVSAIATGAGRKAASEYKAALEHIEKRMAADYGTHSGEAA
jgi:chromosome partitioning protein